MGHLRAALFTRAISNPEMEFLEIKFTKDLSFLLPLYSQSFVLADFKDNHILFSGLKIYENRKLECFRESHFVKPRLKNAVQDIQLRFPS
jgi:hypothetical protein